MKNKILFIIGTACILFSSCDDILDIPNPNSINPEIWDSEQSATLYINNLYSYMPTSYFQFVSNTDDASSYYPWGGNAATCDEANGATTFTQGLATSESVTFWDANTYTKIRYINMALENLAKSGLAETPKNRLIGEASFIRAWIYWNMVLLYGGVPIVETSLNPYTQTYEDMDVPRHKTSECIDFICRDLDKAIFGLPATVEDTERVRAVRAAAAALKGRILLFYASPQFNPNNDISRWRDAFDANDEANKLCIQDGYGLNDNFEEIFTKRTNESLMITKAYNLTLSLTHGWENAVRPYNASIGGGRRCNPTWNLVESFPMKNGKLPIDPTSGYEEKHYWENRDDRFKYTIAYNGAEWTLAGMTDPSFSGSTMKTIWTYTGSNTMTTNATNSGFYCRKATNPTIDKAVTDKCFSDWIELRYAEVLLNLAEAAYEVGETEVAYQALIKLRQRAGIDAGTDGYYGLKSTFDIDLLEVVMNERKIELAFENKRFWDARRRNMFNEALGQYTPQLNGTQRLRVRISVASGYTAADINALKRDEIDMADYDKYFNAPTKAAEATAQRLAIPEAYNFFDLPLNIRSRSQTLKQTSGWENPGEDAFNPYE